MLKAYFDDVAN